MLICIQPSCTDCMKPLRIPTISPCIPNVFLPELSIISRYLCLVHGVSSLMVLLILCSNIKVGRRLQVQPKMSHGSIVGLGSKHSDIGPILSSSPF